MLTRLEARARIEQEIAEFGREIEIVIVDDDTQEHDWGWVFFYTSKKYLETDDFRDKLLGNAPFIVNKHNGDIVVTGTARPTAEYVRDYELKIQNTSHGDA